ncbi:kinase-like protein [Durotheca rogersii]|uniref:kinase-like protein n=1 Tax=Durotheca rogersii TaxID=419775 RepID=UPI002220D9CB|nr:kinase-like protein [Durotheca rogersii]KAI5862584.1 kinase-like protein [Durotheca rogersii]
MSSHMDVARFAYLPSEVGACEDLENYKPGGLHPVHLGDVYDGGRYRVVHKLGFGGASTVWLAADGGDGGGSGSGDVVESRWVALKIVAARASAAASHVSATASLLSPSRLFAAPARQFWIDGPNGRHACLVLPALGPDLSRLARGVDSRLTPRFAARVCLQVTLALAQLHSRRLCHGDLATSKILLRLEPEFYAYSEADLVRVFGPPRTAPLRTCSGRAPGPRGPDYVVAPLDFCAPSTNLLSGEICILGRGQPSTPPPAAPPDVWAPHLAPEVAVAGGAGPASDVWALGCAIFRIRSGEDLFCDTGCADDGLRQIESALGPLPDAWRETRFDGEGRAVVGDRGEGERVPFWSLDDAWPLEDRVWPIADEPPGLFLNGRGEAADGVVPEDEAERSAPYPPAFAGMVWKPTAVSVDGSYLSNYSDEETEVLLEAFPTIPETEAVLLLDLLYQIFTYDPAERPTVEKLCLHPWFSVAAGREWAPG